MRRDCTETMRTWESHEQNCAISSVPQIHYVLAWKIPALGSKTNPWKGGIQDNHLSLNGQMGEAIHEYLARIREIGGTK